MPADPQAKPQEQLGPYRLVRQIGSGGMACVYEAEHVGLGHRVALKRLHPHIEARPGERERFVREGRAAAHIHHPHVLSVHTLGEVDGSTYLAMELLDGQSLSAMLEHKGSFGLHEALSLLLPVFAGVAAAHDAGVIHRDLKPSNIVAARLSSGRLWPKVVDFGISRFVGGEGTQLTESGAVVGTAAYMAPEQACSARNASFQSDQYSLAVILYECLTGQAPFGGDSLWAVLQAVMTAPVVPPSELAAGLTRELDQVILRAMSREPAARFASVRAFGAALLPFASSETRNACESELRAAPPAESERGMEPWVASTLSGEVVGSARTIPGSHAARPRLDDARALRATPVSEVVPPRRTLTRSTLGAIALAATVLVLGSGAALWKASRTSAERPPTPALEQPSAPVVRETPPEVAAVTAAQPAAEPPQVADVHEDAPSPPPVREARARRAARAREPASKRVPPAEARASEAPAIPMGENGAPILP